ncbi:MAG TPA: serine/threonine-protein kinase [Polyangia bacterium]|nr:serine/threonine-protein kinase [Polyangia bacterium]
MSSGARTGLGVLLVVAGLGIGALGITARGGKRSVARAPDELKAAAAALHPRLDDALKAATSAVESKAAAAAHLPEIASALDLDADAHTIEDLLSSEEWWSAYRAEFTVNGVVSSGGQLATIGPLDRELAGAPVVKEARDAGSASRVMMVAGRAYLLAGARVPAGRRRGSGAVVVLGTPFSRGPLQAISDAVGTPVGLSDGRKLLAFAGAPSSEMALAAMLGHEDQGVLALDDTRAAAAWPLDKGLSLVAVLPALAPVAPAGPPVRWELQIALGGGFLIVAALLLMRRAPAAGVRSDLDNPMAITQPFGSGPKPAPVVARDRRIDLRAPQPPGMPPPITVSDRAPGGSAPAGERASAVGAAAHAEGSVAQGAAVLGRYKLIERIGEGGMAEIFIAAAHGAEGFVRNFVVKRMHPHMARNREAVSQFIDEARLQSVLVHSNVVPVFDFGRAGEEYFLALEYIHGRDLEAVVRRHVELYGRSLSVPVAFYLMHEVLEALAYAHGRADAQGHLLGIVHRDVAPGNVLVSMRGEVKLSDFGIAKSAARMSRTEVGMIKGNVSFMAPEQARGEPVDHRTDLFSAAVVLYYCLTAQFLYREGSLFSGLARAAIGPTLSEFTQMDQIPPLAADVLRKGLALDPAKRYQTAREFARDLAGHFTQGRSELSDLMESLFPELAREVR